MKRLRAVPAVLAATVILSLSACDDRPSPAEPVEPALANMPGGPPLPELPAFCAADTYERTPEQVLDDHRAALAIGDFDAVYCNYAEGAVVIADGGIDVGQDAIRASLEFVFQVFGGVLPQVVQQIVVEVPDHQQFPSAANLDRSVRTHMVRLLFTLDTPCVIIPDGIDTYVIRSGQIHAQTAHGLPVFPCS